MSGAALSLHSIRFAIKQVSSLKAKKLKKEQINTFHPKNIPVIEINMGLEYSNVTFLHRTTYLLVRSIWFLNIAMSLFYRTTYLSVRLIWFLKMAMSLFYRTTYLTEVFGLLSLTRPMLWVNKRKPLYVTHMSAKDLLNYQMVAKSADFQFNLISNS